jgi:uncharacterized membrane protein
MNWNHISLLFLFFTIALSVVASVFLKSYGDNSLVIVLLIVDISYIVLLMSKKLESDFAYSVALFAISISVLYCFALRFDHIFGNDIHLEYYEFKNTFNSGQWVPRSLYASCLSITILPTIFSLFTGFEGELIFRFLYPFILSLVPVVLYKLFSNWLSRSLSFLSALFLIANSIYFIQMLSLTRQIVSYFFFALVLYLLYKLKPSIGKKSLFFVLSFGLITAHYATGWLFVLILFSLLSYPYVKGVLRKMQVSLEDRTVTSPMFLMVLGLVFAWYGIVCTIPLSYSTFFAHTIILRLTEFFRIEARADYALRLVGVYEREGLPNVFGLWFGNMIRGLMLVGLAVFYLRPNMAKHFKINGTYAFLGLESLGTLLLFLGLPYITSIYNLDRVYLTQLVFLVPFLPVGVHFILTLVKKSRVRENLVALLLAGLLVIQMMYGTGLLHQVLGYQSFVVLNKFETAASYKELSPDARYFIFNGESAGVLWLSKSIDGSIGTQLVSDHIGKLVMSSQGLIPYNYESLLNPNTSQSSWPVGTLFYLRFENLEYDRMWVGSSYVSIQNVTVYVFKQNKVYDAGLSSVYQVVFIVTK